MGEHNHDDVTEHDRGDARAERMKQPYDPEKMGPVRPHPDNAQIPEGVVPKGGPPPTAQQLADRTDEQRDADRRETERVRDEAVDQEPSGGSL